MVTIALFYVFWSYWYSPKQEEIAANNERLEALVQNNRLAEIQVARGGDELEARLAQYEGHVDRLEGLIPQSEEVASLLNQISSAARETGVSDPNMSPEPQEVGAFYTKDSYQIEVIGEYHMGASNTCSIATTAQIIAGTTSGNCFE